MSLDRSLAALVVPCYNESARLRPAEFLAFLGEHPQVHFLLVDDGSGDGTWTLLEQMRARAPGRIAVLGLERNQGKGEAVRQGMLAFMEGQPFPGETFRLVGFWDADLSTPLHSLLLFMEAFAQRPDCRLVMGSRVRLLGRHIVRKPLRHYLGRVFSTFASLSLGLPVYDTQCGAKLFRADEDLRAVLSRPFSDPWLFDVEILARFQALWGRETERRIYELPLPAWEDVGASKVRLRDGARAAVSLAMTWLKRVKAGR
jgi:glycosyltransferase involved in cell wall biosynthesis